ncbi:MAG TPA: hypothetical protein DCP02_07580 [Actinobacteria bacterium]|nr:hypothetical protein [Actinomycetota bacterium]
MKLKSIFKLNTRWKLTLIYFMPIFIIISIFAGLIIHVQNQKISEMMASVDAYIPDEIYYSGEVLDGELFAEQEEWQKEYEQLYKEYEDEYIPLENKWDAVLEKLDEAFSSGNEEEIEKIEEEMDLLFSEQMELDEKSGISELFIRLYENDEMSSGVVYYGDLPDYIFTDIIFAGISDSTNIGFLKDIMFLMFASIIIFGGIAHIIAGKTIGPITESLKKQKQFVADASHELRTPLTLIRAEAEVLLHSKKSKLADYKAFGHQVINSVKGLELMINSLLQIVKLDADKSYALNEKIDLEAVLNNIIDKYKHKFKNISFSLKKEKSRLIPVIYGNAVQIKQLFMILLDNATKFNIKEGKVDILLSKDDKKSQFIVKISDSGKGISQKDLPNIFNRFYAAEENRNKKGHGLGLSIAGEIIKKHKADVSIYSKLSKGTTVEVAFRDIPKK